MYSTVTYSATQNTILREHGYSIHVSVLMQRETLYLGPRIRNHFNADPDPAFHLKTYPALDRDPAPHQSDENL
jgi:hypothetical protein